MPTRPDRRTQMTRQLALAGVVVALGVLATLDAWVDIFTTGALDAESSYIFLVLPVCAWLVWVRRSRLRYCQFHGSYIGPVVVAAGWLISSIGYRHSIHSFFQGGAVVVAIGCIVTALGRDILVRFLPAFFVLVFLVPIPGRFRQSVSIPMMTTTAQITQQVSEILGIPVERSGNQLTINGQKVGIIEACNGLRMAFALVLVSYAFAFGEPLRNYVRALILLASPLSAILCNVVRLVPTLWLHGYAKPSVATAFHDWAGWAMLVVGFLMLMGIIRLLRWAMIPVTHYTLASSE